MDGKTMIVLVAIAVVAVLGVYVMLGLMNPNREYVCADGRVVSSPKQCPTSTTMEPTTTEIAVTTGYSTIATTKPTSMQTTPTTLACYSDRDCGGNVNSTPYCSDSYVKTDVMKPVCISPGREGARCAFTPTGVKNVLQKCVETQEFCSQGMCILRQCVNGRRDAGEEKIDCGGVCLKQCDEFSVLCNSDGDCGGMKCSTEYYCLETNPAYTCYFKQCVNNGTTDAICVDANKTVVKHVCGRGRHCEPGKGACMEGGTCSDCTRNQDEVKVDCGGSCRPCAAIPEDYSTLQLSGENDFKADYRDRYGNTYLFVLNKVLVENRCPHGINLRIDNAVDGSVVASGDLDIYENATFLKQERKYKFHVGLLNVSSSSATIWIVEPE